jgi:hypothetical protein
MLTIVAVTARPRPKQRTSINPRRKASDGVASALVSVSGGAVRSVILSLGRQESVVGGLAIADGVSIVFSGIWPKVRSNRA